MRFLHAADVHIDSPLRGLANYEGAPVDRIRSATRRSFENLIQLALDEQVRFVILAGDLFDGHWPDMQTGLWTARQFRRLESAGILVYLLRGNHDAASVIQHDLEWPENVHRFAESEPTTFELAESRVALHGQGFAERETREDLVAGFPAAIDGMFNIGVLHTSLAGTSAHDVYAPTHEEVLVRKRYDYWALGHVHQRQVVRENPAIVYPGNTQGRNIRETGAKGCYVVDVVDRHLRDLRFVPLDAVRWHRLEVALDESSDVPLALEQVRDALAECRGSFEGRFHAIRLVLCGACQAHSEFADPVACADVAQRIRYEASQWDSELWIEKIQFETEPLIDLQQLRESKGPMGDLLREIAQLVEQPHTLAALGELFEPLQRKAATELHGAGVDCRDPEILRGWLQNAEKILATLESAK